MVILAVTGAVSRRALPRARVSASSVELAVALARVWSRPRAWAACRFGEWVSTSRRSAP